MKITTHLELFPNLLLLLLTFKLLSLPFPLRWSQTDIPSEGIDITAYLEFHCLILFHLAFA